MHGFIMEKSILKRAGRLGLAGLLAVTGAVSGCATTRYANIPNETKREYNQINPYKLTAEQRKYLSDFNKYFMQDNVLPDKDKKWIREDYPFIDADDLSLKDKVFLMKEVDRAFSSGFMVCPC